MDAEAADTNSRVGAGTYEAAEAAVMMMAMVRRQVTAVLVVLAVVDVSREAAVVLVAAIDGRPWSELGVTTVVGAVSSSDVGTLDALHILVALAAITMQNIVVWESLAPFGLASLLSGDIRLPAVVLICVAGIE